MDTGVIQAVMHEQEHVPKITPRHGSGSSTASQPLPRPTSLPPLPSLGQGEERIDESCECNSPCSSCKIKLTSKTIAGILASLTAIATPIIIILLNNNG